MTTPPPDDRSVPNTTDLDAQLRTASVVKLVLMGQCLEALNVLNPPPSALRPEPLCVPRCSPHQLVVIPRHALRELVANLARASSNPGRPHHISDQHLPALEFADPAELADELLASPGNCVPRYLPPKIIERAAAANPHFAHAISALPCRPIIRAMADSRSDRELAEWTVANLSPHLLDLVIGDACSQPWWVNAWGIMRRAMLDHHRDGWLTQAINRHGVGPFIHPVQLGPAAHDTNTDVRRTIDLACELGAIGAPGSLPLDANLLEGLVGNIRGRRKASSDRLRHARDDSAVKAVLGCATNDEIVHLCTESVLLAYEEAIARQMWVHVIPVGLRANAAAVVGHRFRQAVEQDPALLERTIQNLGSLARGSVHSLPMSVAELAVRMKRLELTWAIARVRARARACLLGRPLTDDYRMSAIPKRDGSMRLLLVPEPWLASLQTAILREVLDPMDGLLHDAAHGFRPHRGIASNASVHVGSSRVVNIDIADFFGSIRLRHIMEALEPLLAQDWGIDTVMLIAEACIADGGLPTGAPTSPAIANHVLRTVDATIAELCAHHGLRYTRYADDLTISAPAGSSVHPVRVVPEIRALLKANGFKLAEQKTCVYGTGSRQLVTGLVTNEHVSVPKHIRRWLRSVQHAVANGRAPHHHGTAMSPAQVRGWQAYLSSISTLRTGRTP